MRDRPGEFTSFDFLPGMPAPLGMGLAILSNNQMLTWREKVLMVPALLPMLLEGQSFIDAQDELSVLEFMEKFGMPRRVNDEIFIAMGKALDFIDPDKLSMTVILTAMNRFINEADGSQTAFLDGNQPDRLCAPMRGHIEARGGEVRTGIAVRQVETSDETGEVTGLRLSDGTQLLADYYVSSVPVDVFKRLTPPAWLDGAAAHFFAPLRALRGIPVINLQLWFDRKLASSLDGLAFSRSDLLSVYADMSRSCREYASDCSMLELVFAPCSPEAGSGGVDWLKKSDEEIIDAAVAELAFLFPDEIAPDARTALGGDGTAQGKAALRKFSVVRVPRSVYAALPGMGKYRPSQETPIRNFVLAGDWTAQKYLGSMEGAVLAGKLAAQVVVQKAAGLPTSGARELAQHAVGGAGGEAWGSDGAVHTGILDGNSPVAFGGGQAGGMVHP
uniref:Amine oxidase domain-containing protein n=1 Tax=Calcidiscus leptoporus TaxID=127549 RepID=A0A7S0J5H8_9EUKA